MKGGGGVEDKMSRIFFRDGVVDTNSARSRIEEGFAFLAVAPSPGERWTVKLNLVIRYYVPGICSGHEVIEALCGFCADRGVKLEFIEGDGGHRAHTAEEAFAGNGISRIAARFGFSCLDVSRLPARMKDLPAARRVVRFPVSSYFLERPFDRFISLTPFKTHVFTTVTLASKNLWGCIPDGFRLYYHPDLDEGIVALVRELRPDFAILGGVVGLDGSGPINGTPRRTEGLLLADGALAADVIGSRLMGIDPRRVRHLKLALDAGLLDEGSLVQDCSPPRLPGPPFRMTRQFSDKAHRLIMYFPPRVQRLIYHSRLSPYIKLRNYSFLSSRSIAGQ